VEVTVYLFLLAKNVANVAAAVAMNDQDQHAPGMWKNVFIIMRTNR
jgi:hypothetical protein